jgi:hypothetical protein
MFDWMFRPSCPCDPAAKDWIEERLRWLADEFDDSAFSGRAVVLPTAECFPDPYDGSKGSVRRLLNRVCQYMDVSPDVLSLKFTSNVGKLWLVNDTGQYLPSWAGSYEEGERKFIIRIDSSELANLVGLVGTMAHELAHVRLMGENRIPPDVFDNELLTDLTVVHFGLGIFLANSPRNWDSAYTRWPDSQLRKPEYMTPPMFGWALAHLAWFRGEERPAWARHLAPGARANLKQGLRYLRATGDTSYRPAGLGRGM